MLSRLRILELIPHQDRMCLLDSMESWSPAAIVCRTRSHLHPLNPLRRDGRLSTLCGIEYGLQAAALHGALAGGRVPQRAGYLAALRNVELHARFLDDPAIDELVVEARLDHGGPSGSVYLFGIESSNGRCLASGRATILLPGST